MSHVYSLARAGQWFLHSGIQESSGGVARYYLAEAEKNKPVSTEITGYTASTLVYLYQVTGEEIYLDRARQTAHFLVDHAWNSELQTFPVEHPSPSGVSDHHSYFFDCGIIIRGLLAVWTLTKEDRLLETGHAAALGMLADFHAGPDYHPILTLPHKEPLERSGQWSRSSGCYQTKSALAWFEVAEATGDQTLRAAYLRLMQESRATHPRFLDGLTPHHTMDRLHAYSYFLEALTPLLNQPEFAATFSEALAAIARNLHKISPSFARSDVYAQLLRARINGAAVVPLDAAAAADEASCLAKFQIASDDRRLDGGFDFGCRDGVFSNHINPVSTAFALQALEMWHAHQDGNKPPCHRFLI